VLVAAASTTIKPLPAAPLYFPLRHGRYDIAPGLTKLGREFGAGEADAKIFQLDDQFHSYRKAKLASRASAYGDYICTANYNDNVAAQISTFIVDRLATEHSGHFRLERSGETIAFHCALTDETLLFDQQFRYRGATNSRVDRPPYSSGLDALACQLQEDLAVLSTDESTERHWISALHICFPNGWDPREKIGRTFAEVHAPVAGMDEMNRRGDEFATMMTRAVQPLVRWAWGVTFDNQLDHHPARPRTSFDPGNPGGFLRVERQTVAGFPARGAALFTIRTYLYDMSSIRSRPELREPLLAALRYMPANSLRYKGLSGDCDALIAWLAKT
jgi:hypothetical protein